MAVVANISVLLSARVEAYRSQIGFARQDNESFARSATAAGLKVRDAGKAMDILRQRSFEMLSTQQKLNEEVQAIGHLLRAGIIDQQNYAKAIGQVNAAYQQKAAAEAAKAQDSFNNAVQRGTQLLRPQIAVQKEAMAEYKKTIAALDAVQKSGTANRLGITAEEVENRRREAFLVGQAKFQGKETPDKIQERTRVATEAATAAVGKFNQQFQTARQRLSDTLAQLRVLREQAELAGKPLDIQAQQQFVRKAIEDYRRDSGLADRLRREQKAQEENNQAIQRGIQLMDQSFAARQRLGQQLRDIQAAAKFDPDRFGGQKLEQARQQAFEAYRAETQKSTELAAASVDKFNQRFVTAKQRLRETINELRVLREQAELAGKSLDKGAQSQFIRKAVEDFRRDSGLTEKLKKEQKAQEENNQAIQRGIQLMDKNFAARQRLGQQLRDIQAAARFDPDRFGGDKLEKARQEAFTAFRAETQKSTELASASVDKFNQRFVTARQRLRETINELRILREQAAQAGKVLDQSAQRQFVKKAVDDFRRDSGLESQLKAEAAARNESNLAAQRGLELVDKEFATNNRRRQQLLQQLADINAAREAYKGLDVRKFAAASRGIFDELNALAQGKESPAAIAEREAAKLAANKVRIEKENVAAITASQTAEQARAAEYARINADIINGLNAEAAARRRLAADTEFNRRTGVDQRQQIEADLVQKYNEAIERGVKAARPAKAATDEYRQSIKDLGKALQQSKISQQEYNLARLQATRIRQDASLSPILQSGIEQVAPYRNAVRTAVRSVEDMRAALQAGAVTQREYNQTLQVGTPPIVQYANALTALRAQLRAGKISQKEFTTATQIARAEIMGQTSVLDRLTRTFGVFRTVFIGLASAQVFGGLFNAVTEGFNFEPQIRRSIALFGELDEATKQTLRQTVTSSTNNNVTLLERSKVLEELAKDGVQADVAIRVFAKTLDFASVSGLNAQDAVSRVSEVLNAYRLKTGDATEDTARLYQAMDLLQFSSTQTASNVLEIAEALIRVAPQANLLNISMREAASGVIALSEIGRKGEVGGNELAIALRDLTIKAVENKQAWEALGLTVFDQDGTYAGMSVTIRQLSNLLSGLSSEQQTLTLLQLGVTQKASQFQQQLVSLIDRLDETKTKFEDTNGAVDKIQKGSLTQLVIMVNKLRTAFSVLVNSTIVAWFDSLAGVVNRDAASFQFWSTIVVAAITGVVVAVNAYRTAITIAAATKAVFLSLSSPVGWLQVAAGITAAIGAVAGLTAMFENMNRQLESNALPAVVAQVDNLARAARQLDNDPFSLVRSNLRNQLFDVFEGFFSIDGMEQNGVYSMFEEIVSRDFNAVQSLIDSVGLQDLRNAEPLVEQLFGDPNRWRPGSEFLQSFDGASREQMVSYFTSLRDQVRDVKFALRELSDEEVKNAVKEYETIFESLRTPAEEALAELEKLDRIQEFGIRVNPIVEDRFVEKVINDLAKEVEGEVQKAQIIRLNAAAEIRGSANEFSSRVAVKFETSEREERRSQHIEAIREMRSQNASLRDIRGFMERLVEQQTADERVRIGEY